MNKRVLFFVIISFIASLLLFSISVNGSSPGNETVRTKEDSENGLDVIAIIAIIIVIILIIAIPIIFVLIVIFFTNRKLSQTHAQLQAEFRQSRKVPPPPCPNCNLGLIFVEKYRKWYCESCNSYY
jgi:ABC-type Fe3+ transport system permease subunit